MEFLELHQKKVVYLIFSLERITIHTWVPAEAVWQSMTNHTDSTGRSTIFKTHHSVQSLSVMWKNWKEHWESAVFQTLIRSL